MNRWRSIASLVALVMLAGCGTMPSGDGGGAQSANTSPRVRCLSDPSLDDRSTSRPMIFLFCVEGP